MLRTVGSVAQIVLFAWFGPDPEIPPAESEQLVGMMLQMVLWSLPYSAVEAAIWGTTLWAVLSVEDWQGGTAQL